MKENEIEYIVSSSLVKSLDSHFNRLPDKKDKHHVLDVLSTFSVNDSNKQMKQLLSSLAIIYINKYLMDKSALSKTTDNISKARIKKSIEESTANEKRYLEFFINKYCTLDK